MGISSPSVDDASCLGQCRVRFHLGNYLLLELGAKQVFLRIREASLGIFGEVRVNGFQDPGPMFLAKEAVCIAQKD